MTSSSNFDYRDFYSGSRQTLTVRAWSFILMHFVLPCFILFSVISSVVVICRCMTTNGVVYGEWGGCDPTPTKVCEKTGKFGQKIDSNSDKIWLGKEDQSPFWVLVDI